MALTTSATLFPPQGILGLGEASFVTGRSLYYNADTIPEDRLSSSVGYSEAELSSADNYVGWPSPPWIIEDGQLPALDSQLP